MLPLSVCRELLGGAYDLTDEQVTTLRDQLYALAETVLDTDAHARRVDAPSASARVLNQLSDDAREAAEERAAIREHDGGLRRDVAERAAVADVLSWREVH